MPLPQPSLCQFIYLFFCCFLFIFYAFPSSSFRTVRALISLVKLLLALRPLDFIWPSSCRALAFGNWPDFMVGSGSGHYRACLPPVVVRLPCQGLLGLASALRPSSARITFWPGPGLACPLPSGPIRPSPGLGWIRACLGGPGRAGRRALQDFGLAFRGFSGLSTGLQAHWGWVRAACPCLAGLGWAGPRTSGQIFPSWAVRPLGLPSSVQLAASTSASAKQQQPANSPLPAFLFFFFFFLFFFFFFFYASQSVYCYLQPIYLFFIGPGRQGQGWPAQACLVWLGPDQTVKPFRRSVQVRNRLVKLTGFAFARRLPDHACQVFQ